MNVYPSISASNKINHAFSIEKKIWIRRNRGKKTLVHTNFTSIACKIFNFSWWFSIYGVVPFGRKVHDEILSSIPEIIGSYRLKKNSIKEIMKNEQLIHKQRKIERKRPCSWKWTFQSLFEHHLTGSLQRDYPLRQIS